MWGTGNSALDQKICFSLKKAAVQCMFSSTPANRVSPKTMLGSPELSLLPTGLREVCFKWQVCPASSSTTAFKVIFMHLVLSSEQIFRELGVSSSGVGMLLSVCHVSVCSVVNQGSSSGVECRLLELMILQPVADFILILHSYCLSAPGARQPRGWTGVWMYIKTYSYI